MNDEEWLDEMQHRFDHYPIGYTFSMEDKDFEHLIRLARKGLAAEKIVVAISNHDAIERGNGVVARHEHCYICDARLALAAYEAATEEP